MSTLRAVTPLILFGAAEDIAGTWSTSSNIVVTGGVSDPLGGTDAVRIEDQAAGGPSESTSIPITTLVPNVNGEAIINLYLKNNGDGDEVDVNLYNDTDTVTVHTIDVNLTTDPITVTSQGGSGTIFPAIDVGGGWWLIRFSGSSVVSGKNYRLFIYPAGTSTGVGDIHAYIRSTLVFGQPLDDAVAYGEPRDGSEHVMAPSGSEDAWIVGRDEMLEGTVRWIPTLDLGDPHNLTGWDGRREATWLNAGWHSFLEFAQDKNTFVWVPDLSDATDNRTCVLTSPMDGKPSLEDDRTRQLEIIIRDTSDIPFEGY